MKRYIHIKSQEMWDMALFKIRNGKNYYDMPEHYRKIGSAALDVTDGSHCGIKWFEKNGYTEMSWEEFYGEPFQYLLFN